MRAVGAKVDARQFLLILSQAVCLLMILACHLPILSQPDSPPASTFTSRPVDFLEQPRQTATPTQQAEVKSTQQVVSASDISSHPDWLMGSDNACCSGVIEWDDFHENIQGYNKTYADIAACSFPLFIDLEHGSIEGKVSGEGAFSEFDSARSQAQFSAVVVQSWVKPLPTLEGWHFGGVLEVYILMNAARKGWIGDSPTWLEGTRSIILHANFIGQTDQDGAPGGVYTWSTQAGEPVSFLLTCQMCPLPKDFPPPSHP